ncbi:MAG: hypothetical protein ACI8Q6_002550 [Granulosicoccus sp.]|jgi:hypothetical protein
MEHYFSGVLTQFCSGVDTSMIERKVSQGQPTSIRLFVAALGTDRTSDLLSNNIGSNGRFQENMSSICARSERLQSALSAGMCMVQHWSRGDPNSHLFDCMPVLI